MSLSRNLNIIPVRPLKSKSALEIWPSKKDTAMNTNKFTSSIDKNIKKTKRVYIEETETSKKKFKHHCENLLKEEADEGKKDLVMTDVGRKMIQINCSTQDSLKGLIDKNDENDDRFDNTIDLYKNQFQVFEGFIRRNNLQEDVNNNTNE